MAGAEDRLRRWLASEHGIADPRRLAREDADRLLLSKFPPGFIARVGETVDRLDLFADPDPLAAATAGAPAVSPASRASKAGARPPAPSSANGLPLRD